MAQNHSTLMVHDDHHDGDKRGVDFRGFAYYGCVNYQMRGYLVSLTTSHATVTAPAC